MSALRETVDLGIATVGSQATVRALQTELVVIQAQLAGFVDMERELRGLIEEVMNRTEGEVL